MTRYEVVEVFVVDVDDGVFSVEAPQGFDALIVQMENHSLGDPGLVGFLVKYVLVPNGEDTDETIKSKPVSCELGRERPEGSDAAPSKG